MKDYHIFFKMLVNYLKSNSCNQHPKYIEQQIIETFIWLVSKRNTIHWQTSVLEDQASSRQRWHGDQRWRLHPSSHEKIRFKASGGQTLDQVECYSAIALYWARIMCKNNRNWKRIDVTCFNSNFLVN